MTAEAAERARIVAWLRQEADNAKNAGLPHDESLLRSYAYLILHGAHEEMLKNNLPDWEDIRGLSPDATGALTSEAFVRKMRDEWR